MPVRRRSVALALEDDAMTDKQRTQRRWPSARCIKHIDYDLFCIYTGPKKRGISIPRSDWHLTRALAWRSAAINANRRLKERT